MAGRGAGFASANIPPVGEYSNCFHVRGRDTSFSAAFLPIFGMFGPTGTVGIGPVSGPGVSSAGGIVLAPLGAVNNESVRLDDVAIPPDE
jgi:hypothetical protein